MNAGEVVTFPCFTASS